jgi:hypothetical protein
MAMSRIAYYWFYHIRSVHLQQYKSKHHVWAHRLCFRTLSNTDSLNLPRGLRRCLLLRQDLFGQDLSMEPFGSHVHEELVGFFP